MMMSAPAACSALQMLGAKTLPGDAKPARVRAVDSAFKSRFPQGSGGGGGAPKPEKGRHSGQMSWGYLSSQDRQRVLARECV